MSFGFSVGDFLAVGKLIADITSSLGAAGGAKSDYQELLRELESLRKALVHIDQLKSHGVSSTTLDSIKYASLSCRHPLEQFLAKVRKHEQSLGLQGKTNVFKSTTDKLRWTFGSSEEVKKLQSYLSVHIGTINILLAQYGLERMDIAEKKAETQHLHIRERLDHTQDIVQETKKNTLAQALVIQNVGYVLGSLYQVVCGPMKVSLESLGQVVAKICVSTQQIYGVVLDIRESMATVDTRWTYFQAPLILEDALGLKFPVPSEYDYGTLEAIIKHRFSVGMGSQDVQVGNYELFKAKRRAELISPTTRLLPGTEIIMAIIIDMPVPKQGRCPMSRCNSPDIMPYPGGGMICSECNVWFDQATKQRQSLYNLVDAVQSKFDSGKDKYFNDEDNIISSTGPSQTIGHGSDNFKNIKLGAEEKMDHRDSVYLDDVEIKAEQQPILNDALEFLDLVKVTTAYDPQIYLRFLDIMKEFKRGVIDTPTVIERVSVLFATNMALIQEFSNFLPPGYHVEYETDGDSVAVRVRMSGGESVVEQVSVLETDNSENEIDDEGEESWRESHSDTGALTD